MKAQFTPPHLLLKQVRLALYFCVLLYTNSGYSQNPTVINDSLVVQQRVYAKEKLIVDQQAKFKEDIVVQGDARMKSDVRIDSTLRVEGTAKFLSNVKMEGIEKTINLTDSTEILIRMPNGQLKTMDTRALVATMYASPCGQVIQQPVGLPPFIPTVNPIWNNGPNKLYVSYCEDVNVGIGTTNPVYILDVRGLAYTRELKVGDQTAAEDALINGFDFTNSRDLIHLGVHKPAAGINSQLRFKITHDGTAVFYNYGGPALISYNSNGDKILQLEDNGTLRAREIRVDENNWPDYVFSKNYKLPSLREVAKYIEKNHHLPGVPSATEIESNGLNLGDMQKIQMQKIEELTLYMIHMNEKIINMENRIEKLEKENNILKSKK